MSHPNTVFFARGTLARLALWPTLRLAVHASWGGPDSAEKQRWLAGILVDQFEPFIVAATPTAGTAASTPPDAPYIEALLLQIMSDEFDVVLEDDSADAVARDLVRLFDEVCTGNTVFLRALEKQAERVKERMPTYEINAGSESGSDESEWEDDEGGSGAESAPQLLDRQAKEEPEVDQDGFTLVKKMGRQ